MIIIGLPKEKEQKVKAVQVSFEKDVYGDDPFTASLKAMYAPERLTPETVIITCKLTLILKYNKEITYKVMVKTDNNSTSEEELRLLALHRLFTNNHAELGSLRNGVMSELIMEGIL